MRYLLFLLSVTFTAIIPNTKLLSQPSEVLLNKALQFKFKNRDSCLILLNEALEASKTEDDDKQTAKVLFEFSKSLRIYQNYESAIATSREGIAYAKAAKIDEYHGQLMESLAMSFNRMNELDSAILYFQKTIDFWNEENIPANRFISLIELSEVYNKLYQDSNSLSYKLQAYEVSKMQGADKSWKLISLMNLVSHYRKNRDYLAYSKYLEEALSEVKDLSLDVKKMPMHSRILLDLEPELMSSQEIAKIIEAHSLSENYLAYERTLEKLGDVAYEEKSFQKAIGYYEKALALGDKNSDKGSLNLFHKSYRSYHALGDKNQALINLEKYIAVRNKMQQKQTEDAIQELNMKYEMVEKEKEILSQELVISNKERRIRNQLYTIILVTIGALGLYLLYLNAKNSKRISVSELKAKNLEIEALEQQSKLNALNYTLEGQEKERSRLSADLHDGLGGILSSIKIMFEGLGKGENDSAAFNKTKEWIDYSCDEVRRITHDMMPPLLQSHGLAPAIQNLAANFSVRQNVQVQQDIRNMDKRLDQVKEVFIYRIAQELFHNISKHANASKVELSLYGLEDQIQLVVEDNGRGFDLLKANSGIGLQSIKSRVDYLKGDIEIDTTENGSSFFISIPI